SKAHGRLSPLVLFLCMALSVRLLFPARGHARLIFDPADPAFIGATLETFDHLGLTTGQTSFAVSLAGATFHFVQPDGQSLVSCDASGCALLSPLPQGIALTISPLVAVIGLQHSWLECPGQITFTGSAGSESFQVPFTTRSLFIGAADIGEI